MVSPMELIVLGSVAILLFGTKKLPELGSGLGHAISNFNKAKSDILNPSNSSPSESKPDEVSRLQESPVEQSSLGELNSARGHRTEE